jgi:Ni,Fe-hydrogenase I cytochrome b subunit
MEWVLLLVLSVLVAMGLLAGQTYVTPRFAQLQSAQASYAGNVAVTAGFIFVALIIAGMLLHVVDKKPVSV